MSTSDPKVQQFMNYMRELIGNIPMDEYSVQAIIDIMETRIKVYGQLYP